MIIYPIGRQQTLDTAKTLSAIYVNLTNHHGSDITVAIIDLDGNVVSDFTIMGKERLTVVKPLDYSLSATGDIHAVPVIRTQ